MKRSTSGPVGRTHSGHSVVARLHLYPSFLRDKSVPAWKKLALLAGALYVISPVDVIPDVLPIIGWLDDIGVMSLAVAWLLRELDRYAVQRSRHA